MHSRRFLPILSLALLTGLACSSPPPPRAPAPEVERAPASPAGSLRFPAQAGWVVETPTSSMRKAQYRLPGATGPEGDASLVVYHFGPGGGGGIEANLERWAGQFEQPDGSDSSAVLRRATRTVNGLARTEVELAGTYVAETSPGSGERVRQEGWSLLAAILEAPGGAYYVKLVGPLATVERWRTSYRSFLDGVRL